MERKGGVVNAHMERGCDLIVPPPKVERKGLVIYIDNVPRLQLECPIQISIADQIAWGLRERT